MFSKTERVGRRLKPSKTTATSRSRGESGVTSWPSISTRPASAFSRPADDAERRGLAGARRAEERQHLPGGEREGHAVQRGLGAEALDQILDVQDRHVRPPGCGRRPARSRRGVRDRGAPSRCRRPAAAVGRRPFSGRPRARHRKCRSRPTTQRVDEVGGDRRSGSPGAAGATPCGRTPSRSRRTPRRRAQSSCARAAAAKRVRARRAAGRRRRSSASIRFTLGEPMKKAGELVDRVARRASGGGADLDDAAVTHQHDAVGERHRLALVVGDVDGRHAELASGGAELPAHLLAELLVDGRQRLVEEQHARLADDRARQRSLLPGARRQGARA